MLESEYIMNSFLSLNLFVEESVEFNKAQYDNKQMAKLCAEVKQNLEIQLLLFPERNREIAVLGHHMLPLAYRECVFFCEELLMLEDFLDKLLDK